MVAVCAFSSYFPPLCTWGLCERQRSGGKGGEGLEVALQNIKKGISVGVGGVHLQLSVGNIFKVNFLTHYLYIFLNFDFSLKRA